MAKKAQLFYQTVNAQKAAPEGAAAKLEIVMSHDV